MNKNSMPTMSDLQTLANNSSIVLGQCGQNAVEVQHKFGGEIVYGTVQSIDLTTHKSTNQCIPHYWNKIDDQIIDIYNHKTDKTLEYFGHKEMGNTNSDSHILELLDQKK